MAERESRLERARREWQPGQTAPPRSVRILFASSVLSLEALLMFFYGLMAWGLYQNEWFAWWLFGGSLVVAALLITTCAFLKRPLGYWMGWGLQFVIIAGGIFEPFMYLIGAAFLLCWWYAVTKGAQLDREKMDRFRAEEELARSQENPADSAQPSDSDQ